MSAIGGLWRFDGRTDAGHDCERMLKAQALYGPDRSGRWSAGDIAMGGQLARLLPEDAYDSQPIVTSGGRFVLAADLRLDNRDEVAAALGMTNEALRRSSDSALLAAAWERWGEECCDRLAGEFAVAAWDAAERRLVLARDFAGGRPLHFHRSDKFAAFASMPKGLHALADIPRGTDREYAIEAMLGAPNDGPATLFAGISRVLPGQIVTITPRGVSERRHWRGASAPRRARGDDAEGLLHHLDKAVRRCLRGANRAGAHLSAGLDSSAVAASAAIALGDSGRLTAFTAVPRLDFEGGSPQGRFGDEGPLAAATAALYPNIEHVLVRPGPVSPLATIERTLFLLDQPAVNLCNMAWINAINDEAKARGLRVMLTGMRGNLAFSYDGLHLLPDLLGRGRLLRLAREIAALRTEQGASVRGALATAVGPYLPADFWSLLARLTGRGPRHWAFGAIAPGAAEAGARRPPRAAPRRPWRSLDIRSAAFVRADIGNFQKAMLGGWGLDYRDPTSDRQLVEYCLSLPPDRFLQKGVKRALARKALRGRLPDALLEERRKGLQGADWHEGATAARAELAREIERAAECGPAAELIDFGYLQGLVENWPRGGWDRPAIEKAYRGDLLRGISVAHFIRKASGSNR